MTERDKIPVMEDSEWTISLFDYVIVKGQPYQVIRNHLGAEPYFKKVDEIPEEYWERWEIDEQ